MTQHELLAFVSGLHDHIVASVSNPGPWCWPTRELLLENFHLNHDVFGPAVATVWNDPRKTLMRKGWLVLGPCDRHCHATHVRITDEGLEALRHMDAHGCEGHYIRNRRERCHREGFHFRRKIAA